MCDRVLNTPLSLLCSFDTLNNSFHVKLSQFKYSEDKKFPPSVCLLNFLNSSRFVFGKEIFNPILFGGRRRRGGGGAKMPYPSGFFKYLQNYLLNWLEIFKVWFSYCLKAVLKKLLKIGVRKALKHTLSWMTPYRKKFQKRFFSFFSIIFHFLSFPCCDC